MTMTKQEEEAYILGQRKQAVNFIQVMALELSAKDCDELSVLFARRARKNDELLEQMPAPAKTLSGLLRLAVADAQKCEADSKFRLDMGVWVHSEGGICAVCLAGAVLSQTCGVSHTGDAHVPHWAIALDSLRSGCAGDAYEELTGETCTALPEAARDILRDVGEHIDRSSDRETGYAPWSVYLEAADMLGKAGL